MIMVIVQARVGFGGRGRSKEEGIRSKEEGIRSKEEGIRIKRQ